ncbi:MAG TPA: chemotaxis response regulator protein-glutamate methylesterase [Candidatus Acidoferrales bacterium]|nr:chemotaxis response regulator protein-glutamate methylesterase [Candidatus Acidoferrales bacterium]
MPIRVLVVDDSAFMRTALSRMITSEPDMAVAGTAGCGSEALSQIASLDPDVVTLDVEMPGLGGLETLRRIMADFPRPVIMISSLTERGAEITLDALSAGAFDYVPKHLSSASLDIAHVRQDVVAKIRAATLSRLRKGLALHRKPACSSALESRTATSVSPTIVALGTSTGGPKALQEILPMLPRDLPVPVLIVQHMPPGFTAPFAQRLNSLCSVTVRQAAEQEPILPGVVYVAPAGMHMTVERCSESSAVVCLDTQPVNCLHMPSVDVLMKSVAKSYGSSAMGIILTGMGSDGAQGMKAIQREGGLTVGQDEASCIVYGMPRACAEMGILSRVVPLSQVVAQILQATNYRKRA